MAYSQVNSSAGQVGELSGALFDGAHGAEGAFSSLKGPMLQPQELSFSDQDSNRGPDRLNQLVDSTGSWASQVIVSTPLTGPGGTLAH